MPAGAIALGWVAGLELVAAIEPGLVAVPEQRVAIGPAGELEPVAGPELVPHSFYLYHDLSASPGLELGLRVPIVAGRHFGAPPEPLASVPPLGAQVTWQPVCLTTPRCRYHR